MKAKQIEELKKTVKDIRYITDAIGLTGDSKLESLIDKLYDLVISSIAEQVGDDRLLPPLQPERHPGQGPFDVRAAGLDVVDSVLGRLAVKPAPLGRRERIVAGDRPDDRPPALRHLRALQSFRPSWFRRCRHSSSVVRDP